jgi:hypothetical protein
MKEIMRICALHLTRFAVEAYPQKMTLFGIIGWLLLLLLGPPIVLASFGMFLQRRNTRQLQALDNVDYGVLDFERVPWWVRLRLKKYRKEVSELGFKEIIVFTRKNIGALNYSCVFVSADGTILAPVEFVLCDPLTMILGCLVMPKKIHQFLFGIAGFCFTTVFPPVRRVFTTKAAYLAECHVTGEKEFHIVDSQLTYSRMLAIHNDAVSEFCQRFGESPRILQTPEEYLRFDQEAMVNLQEVLVNLRRDLQR